MSGALDGVVVADFSRVLAGPYATMLLADLGAEVLKVERPGSGDDTRHWGPPYAADGQATYFSGVNRNKTTLWLDLATPEGRAEARDLALRADVVVENFKPGGLDRMGLGYAALSGENPRTVVCSISGFGSGAGAALPGYDLLVQAMGGLMSVTGPGAGHPTKVGVALVDVGGVQKRISLALVEDVACGDYVIVHVGYALTRLDPEEAQRTLDIFAQAGLTDQEAA